MEADHFSKEWDDAPMPHSIFFTSEGHAIHGSFHIKSLGTRASTAACAWLRQRDQALRDDRKAGMQNTTVIIKGGFFDTGIYSPKSGLRTGRPLFWTHD